MAKKDPFGSRSEVVTITMTRQQALERGLVHCKHCGYPPNNHFDFEPFRCAHDNTCPGYEEKIG